MNANFIPSIYLDLRYHPLNIRSSSATSNNVPISKVRPLPINFVPYDLFAKFNGACVGGPSGVTYAYLHNKSVC